MREEEKDTETVDLEQMLSDGVTVQLYPRGWSMYPLIIPGRDQVRIAPPGERKLKRGEVVLFRRKETPEWNSRIPTKTIEGKILVIHRICRIRPEGVFMVGDNQKLVEGPLEEEQIKGVMVGVVRKGKYISVKNPLYRIYAGLWLFLRPIRPFFWRVLASFRRGCNNNNNA